MENRYWSPARAAGTSADQMPLFVGISRTSGVLLLFQPLKEPKTVTCVAVVAQTRNVTPVPAASA